MPNEHDEQAAIDALDREWESLRRGRAPSPALDPAVGETVRRMHQLPDEPGPDASFVNRLEHDLMTQATATVTITKGPHSPGAASRPPAAVPVAGQRRRWGGTRVLEALAAAVLIALIGGGLYLSRGLGPPDRTPPTQTTGYAVETAPAATPAAGDAGTAMYLGNAARTGVVPAAGPQQQPAIRDAIDIAPDLVTAGWMLATEEAVYLHAMTINPNEPQGPYERMLVVAIDRAGGQERWRVDLGSTDEYGALEMAVAGGRVVVSLVGYDASGGITHGVLVALDARNGRESWRVEMPDSGLTAPAVSDGVVYAGAYDGSVVALDAATGDELWLAPAPQITAPDEMFGESAVAVSDGTVYSSDPHGALFALDAATGEERWRFDPGELVNAQPAAAGGRVFLVGNVQSAAEGASVPGRRIIALDAASGEELWRITLESDASWAGLVAAGDLVVVTHTPFEADGTARLVAFAAATGEERWSFSAEQYLDEPPVVAGGVLYTTGWADGVELPGPLQGMFGLGQSSHLYGIDLATGQQLWRVTTDQMISRQLAVSGGDILVMDHLGSEGNESNAIYVYGDDAD